MKRTDGDPGELTDRELLLVMHTNLTNHLSHHDMYTKIALTAAIVGAVNFGFGILLILLQFGLLAGK